MCECLGLRGRGLETGALLFLRQADTAPLSSSTLPAPDTGDYMIDGPILPVGASLLTANQFLGTRRGECGRRSPLVQQCQSIRAEVLLTLSGLEGMGGCHRNGKEKRQKGTGERWCVIENREATHTGG